MTWPAPRKSCASSWATRPARLPPASPPRGLIGLFISADAKKGAVIEVNCETDFVAKNDDFVAFVNKLAELVATQNPADVAALSALPYGDGTVETTRTALIGKIGENMAIRRFERIETPTPWPATCTAAASACWSSTAARKSAGSGHAHRGHQAKALNADGVNAADIAAERSVAEQKAAESGKPAEIVAKMVEGSVQKFLKEVTLLSQPFVKDDKNTVEQMLKAKGASITKFVLFVVGEGIEKKTSDFAAEVAAAAAGRA